MTSLVKAYHLYRCAPCMRQWQLGALHAKLHTKQLYKLLQHLIILLRNRVAAAASLSVQRRETQP